MKCISSPELDDTQIIRYLEGEADDAVVVHIKECPFCREKASRWDQLQNGLRKQVYRATCPTSMELGDYHLGLLPAPQVLAIAQHLRGCPLCRRDLAEMEAFLTDESPEAGLLGTVKVLIARLTGVQAGSGKPGENDFAPAVPELRGKAKGPLTFAADGIVIVVDIEPTNAGKANILGQVAADDQEQWTGALVELHQDNVVQFSTRVDDLGAFRYESVMPGPKSLRIISKDNSLIVVSNFEVSS